MTGREAYRILVLGKLHRDYSENYSSEKARIIRHDYRKLLEKGELLKEDVDKITAAIYYAADIKPTGYKGCCLFESIYDLLLNCEMVEFNKFSPSRPILWRGHRSHAWRLIPTMFRESSKNISHEIIRTESAARFLLESGRIKQLTPERILSILQHYGFLTPFLDFTHDIHIAAAFACRGLENKDSSIGAIIKLDSGDHSALVPGKRSGIGDYLIVEANDVPRIRLQRGSFLKSFKSTMTEEFLAYTRYFFKHNSDSDSFHDETGLTDDVLFPIDDSLFAIFKEYEGESLSQEIILSQEEDRIVRKVSKLLHVEAHLALEPISFRDYYKVAKKWVDWENIGHCAIYEIEVACRWFEKLRSAEIPLLCRDLRSLQMLVEALARFPGTCTEDHKSNVLARLQMVGKGSLEAHLQNLLAQARSDASNLEYVFTTDGCRDTCEGWHDPTIKLT